MRQGQSKKAGRRSLVRSSVIEKTRASQTRRLKAIVVLLVAPALLAAAARAYNGTTQKDGSSIEDPTGNPLIQSSSVLPTGSVYSKLSFQPEADKMRRRLGQRFLVSGHEQSIITGTITVGTEQHLIAIARTQRDDESITIGFDGLPPVLSWTPSGGARSQGSPATGATRGLIERIALDSPDQFLLAQTRGASYYTVARGAIPPEAAGSETYSGPVWDLVRIGEPVTATSTPLSLSRLYYINSSTGLIDKIASQEQGDTIISEFSNWIDQAGEVFPTRIVWKANNQTLMQLTVTSVVYVAA